jgi:hypothetical protein
MLAFNVGLNSNPLKLVSEWDSDSSIVMAQAPSLYVPPYFDGNNYVNWKVRI